MTASQTSAAARPSSPHISAFGQGDRLSAGVGKDARGLVEHLLPVGATGSQCLGAFGSIYWLRTCQAGRETSNRNPRSVCHDKPNVLARQQATAVPKTRPVVKPTEIRLPNNEAATFVPFVQP
jgi:hypothetical protein